MFSDIKRMGSFYTQGTLSGTKNELSIEKLMLTILYKGNQKQHNTEKVVFIAATLKFLKNIFSVFYRWPKYI